MRKGLIVLLYAAVMAVALVMKADTIAALDFSGSDGSVPPLLRTVNLKLYGGICTPPVAGDWTITAGTTCTCYNESWAIPSNVLVYGTLDMEYGCNLIFSSTTKHIYVYSGGKIYVSRDAAINLNELGGWSYRKSHTIVGTTVGAQTDYQMNITVRRTTGTDNGADVYVGTKALSNYGDIRFTTADGVPLYYWLERNDTNTANIWVKLPSIPASPGTTTIYMYYGNAGAESQSNGTKTFIDFDDFENATVNQDPPGWVITQAGAGNVYTTTDGANKIVMLDRVSATTDDAAIDRAGLGLTSAVVGIRFKASSTVDDTFNVQITDASALRSVYASTSTNGFDCYYGAAWNPCTSITFSANTWYTSEFHVNTSVSTYDIYIDGVERGTAVPFREAATGTDKAGFRNVANAAGIVDDWVDNFYVRKYVPVEPMHGSWGSEEAL